MSGVLAIRIRGDHRRALPSRFGRNNAAGTRKVIKVPHVQPTASYSSETCHCWTRPDLATVDVQCSSTSGGPPEVTPWQMHGRSWCSGADAGGVGLLAAEGFCPYRESVPRGPGPWESGISAIGGAQHIGRVSAGGGRGLPAPGRSFARVESGDPDLCSVWRRGRQTDVAFQFTSSRVCVLYFKRSPV